ncbi:MAG: putative rane protein [Mycobacterium sp.]|nr:putative rane protein [Mycobacterium sp.]
MVRPAETLVLLPPVRELGRHAGTSVLQGAVLPSAAVMTGGWTDHLVLGLTVACCGSLVALAWRAARARRASGMLLLSALGLTTRCVLVAATGSTAVFLVGPLLAAGVAMLACGVTARRRVPLAARVAGDLVPLPDGVTGSRGVGAAFRQITWLWAGLNALNVGINGWLLVRGADALTAVSIRSVVGPVLTGGAIVVAGLLLRRALAADGVQLRCARRGEGTGATLPTAA